MKKQKYQIHMIIMTAAVCFLLTGCFSRSRRPVEFPVYAVAVTIDGDEQEVWLLPARQSDFNGSGLFWQPPPDNNIIARSEKNGFICYVLLYWPREYSPAKYEVYRSSSPDGPWDELNSPLYDVSSGNFYLYDTEAAPGESTFYLVVEDIKGTTRTQHVTPLNPFTVELVAPGGEDEDDEDYVFSPNPLLEWSRNELQADGYFYELYVMELYPEAGGDEDEEDENKGAIRKATAVLETEETAFRYDRGTWDNGFDLENYWIYQWDIYYTDAYKLCGNYSLALSIGRTGNAFGSCNGAFVFTTGELE